VARIAGILALISLIFSPVSLPLGIVAWLCRNRAANLARKFPDSYRAPSRFGLIVGILAIIFAVISFFFGMYIILAHAHGHMHGR
jgi:uncharacterized membrane protein HdeD (DUF308 family)